MIKKCEENEITRLEDIYTTTTLLNALVLDGKLQYFDKLRETISELNSVIFELQNKYDVIQSKIEFKSRTITGIEKDKNEIVMHEYVDSNVSNAIMDLDVYRTILRNWNKEDKIDYDFLYNGLTGSTEKLFSAFTNLGISTQIFKNNWNYLYDSKKIIIIRK